MKISRKGSYRNRGTQDIIPRLDLPVTTKYWKDNVHWNESSKSLVIKANSVPNTDGRTSHDYQISFSVDDVATLIGVLGHAAAKSDAELLRKCLSEQIPAIVKLLACATGIQPLDLEG